MGRFAQADTIIPPGVQGLDRYAYVRNNPLRYTDPTGHREYCEDEPNGRCPVEGKDYPTPIDPSQLSDDGNGNTRISGRDFYKWYTDLFKNKSGWWWKMFGNDADGFTIWDAFVVVYVFETSGHWTDPNMAEAAIRDANTWCGGNCTTAGYVNHFAHEYQSGGNWFRAGEPPDPYTEYPGPWPKFTEFDAQALQKVAASFTNHPAAWNEGCHSNTPCGWANNNAAMYPEEIRMKLHTNQYALFTYSPNNLEQSPWFIPSGCVVGYWLEGVLNAICDPVR